MNDQIVTLPVVQLDPATGYAEFRAKLDQAKKDNANRVIRYEEPKGNKEARSLVHSLRGIKGEIERKRKSLKEAALVYGREVDSYAKSLTAEVEEMIQVHEVPLLEIENRERERQAAIQARMDAIISTCAFSDEETAEQIGTRLVLARNADTSLALFESRAPEADLAKASAVSTLEARLVFVQKREAEAAELARLRAEEEARKQRELDEQIAREAREEAERKAEEERLAAERRAAEREREIREEAARKEQAAKEEAARIQRESEEREAEAKRQQEEAERRAAEAERRAKDAAEAERKRIADEQAAEAARLERERLEREANEAHVRAVNQAAIDALSPVCGISAPEVVELIAAGKVPGVRIEY